MKGGNVSSWGPQYLQNSKRYEIPLKENSHGFQEFNLVQPGLQIRVVITAIMNAYTNNAYGIKIYKKVHPHMEQTRKLLSVAVKDEQEELFYWSLYFQYTKSLEIGE